MPSACSRTWRSATSMTGDPPRPLADNDLLLGGRSADLDGIAALLGQLAAGSPPLTPALHADPMPAAAQLPGVPSVGSLPAMAHMPGASLGRTGPSRPLPPSTGTNPFET